MIKASTGRTVSLLLSGLALTAAALPAQATEGYFQYGYGARQKGLAGAGAADGRDATTISLNPAGLTHVGNEMSMSMTVFAPRRQVEGGGTPGFTPDGVVESGNDWFYIPNMAMSYRLAPNPFVDVVGVQMYGNGGMNTDYAALSRPMMSCGGGTGVFCGGKAGVNLQQALLSIAFSKALGPVSIGVAPTIARQQIEVEGLGAFGMISTNPNFLTNSGTNTSWGGGVRAGLEWTVMPGLRVGLAGNSPMWMTSFSEYKGLFAEGGKFDIPASLQAGIAYDVSPALTLMFDYRHIWYSGVPSIANPSTNALACAGGDPAQCLGGSNGAGFGWKDVDAFKVGAEWRYSPALTFRAGYAYNTAAIGARDAMFNIIAPGVVQHHVTGGLEFKYNSNWSLELAGAYAPRVHLTGSELPGFGAPTHTVDLSMEQFEVTAGIKYKY